jgi:hypothetical protein
MSTAQSIHLACPPPVDPSRSTIVHGELIGDLIAGAEAEGWQGAEFCDYERRPDMIAIGIRRGEDWPGLDELRAFRERQKAERAAAEQAAEEAERQAVLAEDRKQGSLQL